MYKRQVLTEAQGESLKSSGGSLRGISRYGYDRDEFLADALGISVEELDAAQLVAYEAELAGRVAAGELTQAEACLLYTSVDVSRETITLFSWKDSPASFSYLSGE